MIKNNSFLLFPQNIFTARDDIIILNPIGSYKVDFISTFFILRPIFYLRIPLIIVKLCIRKILLSNRRRTDHRLKTHILLWCAFLSRRGLPYSILFASYPLLFWCFSSINPTLHNYKHLEPKIFIILSNHPLIFVNHVSRKSPSSHLIKCYWIEVCTHVYYFYAWSTLALEPYPLVKMKALWDYVKRWTSDMQKKSHISM